MSISAPFFRALGRFALPSVLRSGGADAFMKSILSLDRQCCRYSACAQRPSAETSACIASVSLCSPFPAKCAHPSCLISRVQSILTTPTSESPGPDRDLTRSMNVFLRQRSKHFSLLSIVICSLLAAVSESPQRVCPFLPILLLEDAGAIWRGFSSRWLFCRCSASCRSPHRTPLPAAPSPDASVTLPVELCRDPLSP